MNTKTVTLSFKRDELLHDIAQVAFVEGDVMRVQEEHDRHQVMDVVQDGNVERVTRMLDVAFALVVEMCYPYSKVPIADKSSLDDEYKERQAYVMPLWLPDDFSQTTVVVLLRLIHEFMVAKVLYDWLSITKPDAAAAWKMKMDDAERDVRTNLHSRIGAVRRPMRPF